MLSSGVLKQRVIVQIPSTERDSRGRREGAWADVVAVSAKIKQLSGTELEKARQLVSTATHRITIRYARNYDLTTKHRLGFEGRFFNIGNINNVEEMNETWVLTVSEDKP